MKLFYGSTKLVRTPIYGVGNPTNDYGLGFYLTDDLKMAKLWASQYKEGGYAITYRINLSNLNVLNIDGDDEKTILSWITILVKNRFDYIERIAYRDVIDWLIKHFDIPVNQYDVIIGYRTDDSYFNYSRGFVSGEISLETLSQALRLGKLGLQYVLISKKAFSSIEFIDSETVQYSHDYEIFRKKTLSEYHELLSKEDKFKNTFIGDLMKKYGE